MSPMIDFTTVQVGQHFGTHVWHAAEALAQRWRQAFDYRIGDGAIEKAYADAGDTAQRLPAAFAFVYTSAAVLKLMPPKAEGGIHAKQAFTYGVAVRVGDVLSTELFVHDKYEKRGRRYVELATRTINQRGEMVLQGLRTTIWAE